MKKEKIIELSFNDIQIVIPSKGLSKTQIAELKEDGCFYIIDEDEQLLDKADYSTIEVQPDWGMDLVKGRMIDELLEKEGKTNDNDGISTEFIINKWKEVLKQLKENPDKNKEQIEFVKNILESI